MELLLWRWSTAVQVTSMIMIAVFFAALSRSVRRPELRLWLFAWLADLGALGLSLGFWYFRPDPRFHHFFFALYLATKTSFVMLMLQGAWVLRGRGGWLIRNEIVFPVIAVFSIAGGMFVSTTNQLGLVAYPVMAVTFLAGGLLLVKPLSSGTAWLAAGFLTRALVLVVETAAYATQLFPGSIPDLQTVIRLFIAAASSFDGGAEWLIALGCVLAVSNRIQRELRESNAELLTAQALAEEANLSKSVFLANMSHELRTPLNAVIGFAQLVARSRTLGTDDRENVAVIRRSGEHLLGLINEVLSISKIESGKLTIESRPFDPREMIKSVASMVKGRAIAAGLEVIVELDPAFPAAVAGDQGKLRQALINLLGNAVKFTKVGSVTIRARWSADCATFEVSDTGYGIAEAELPALFEPFVQTASGRQAREGTGLGLAITRQLVRLMGGEITVTSRIGEGTTFRFDVDLPLVTEPIQRLDSNRVVGFESEGKGRRILVVDDTRDGRVLLHKLLETVGLEVREATNGAEAVEMWKSWNPELILMDNRMPVMDGSEATETIRRLEADLKRNPVVIVAVTASVFEHERGAILARGADEFVMKPFGEEKIFEIIASRLGIRFRREGDLAENKAGGSRVLLVDDEGISRRVAGEMLRRHGVEVTDAAGGAEALALLASREFDVVLLDLEMPEVDGKATLQAIRDQERFRTLPVIAMTAHDSEEASLDGMSGYLPKPLDERQVINLLGRYLRLAAPQIADDSAVEGESHSTLKIAEGIRRTSGNVTLYKQLLRSFRADYADVASRLRQKDGDSGATAMLLHSLRGSAATIGANDLANETARLEAMLLAGGSLVLDSFARCLDETIASIDSYAIPATSSQTEVSVPFSRAGVLSITRRMDALLHTNDLSALDCYRELKLELGGNVPSSVQQLGAAVEQLDFDAARVQLKKVEAELGTL